ncbi:MAG: membrane protein insertase YidC [Gemmatimonadetes bacterium]|nr:membrane protein insertase YidC [Gemmatimonadota bacterium]
MKAEARFILAVMLMMAVLIGGNLLFPPAPPGSTGEAGGPGAVPAEGPGGTGGTGSPLATAPASSTATVGPAAGDILVPVEPSPQVVEREIVVEGPLYTITLSNFGGRITSIELHNFESFTRDGSVELIDDGDPGLLGARVVVEGDTLDLRSAPFEVSPPDGLLLEPGGETQTLTLRSLGPAGAVGYEVAYTFHPDTYLVDVRGTVRGVGRGILMTDLGWGLSFNEVDERTEARAMAYVVNHLQSGIQATGLAAVSTRTAQDGPFLWAATKSQYFVLGLLPALGSSEQSQYLGGVVVTPEPAQEGRTTLAVTQSVGSGAVAFRLYAGPQDYGLLTALGSEFQQLSPFGWRWFRPVLRPIVAGIMWVLVFFHQNLAIGYGWVLILVGVLMRVVLFPLNQRAGRAQLKNMVVQPLLKDIQTRYKDQPERMQQELMKLYKEHGFNPLAGCWPMLLPMPLLIALFFVFRNTIELRGVPFWWLPDLAAKDPIFVLPVLLGVSMFLMQWISMRSVADTNPQMKMMLWFMPIVMVAIFLNFPSGLNLYYLSANIATLPQSWWIAQERQKVQVKLPPAPAKP